MVKRRLSYKRVPGSYLIFASSYLTICTELKVLLIFLISSHRKILKSERCDAEFIKKSICHFFLNTFKIQKGCENISKILLKKNSALILRPDKYFTGKELKTNITCKCGCKIFSTMLVY